MATSPTFEIVIAHYNEDLSWLKGATEACIIYHKGGEKSAPPYSYTTLPNIGREGHTYLHHIVQHYDTLPSVTIFLQGRIDDHVSIPLDDIIERSLKTKDGEVTTFPFRELELFDMWDGIPWNDYPCWGKWNSMACLKAPKTPGEYWKQFFPSTPLPLSVGFQPAALFAVTKATIQQHPRELYQIMLEDLFLGEMQHVNPETGHFWERFWLAMFNPKEYACAKEEDVAAKERNELGQLAKGKWHRTPKWVEVDEFTLPPTGLASE